MTYIYGIYIKLKLSKIYLHKTLTHLALTFAGGGKINLYIDFSRCVMNRVNDGNRGYEQPGDLLVAEAIKKENLNVEFVYTNDDDGISVTVISNNSGDEVTVVHKRKD